MTESHLLDHAENDEYIYILFFQRHKFRFFFLSIDFISFFKTTLKLISSILRDIEKSTGVKFRHSHTCSALFVFLQRDESDAVEASMVLVGVCLN